MGCETMNRIIVDISNFIFIEDKPQNADAIMIVGGSHPEQGEKAAELFKRQYAPLILASGGVSIKTGKFPGRNPKPASMIRIIKPNMSFLPMYS